MLTPAYSLDLVGEDEISSFLIELANQLRVKQLEAWPNRAVAGSMIGSIGGGRLRSRHGAAPRSLSSSLDARDATSDRRC